MLVVLIWILHTFLVSLLQILFTFLVYGLVKGTP